MINSHLHFFSIKGVFISLAYFSILFSMFFYMVVAFSILEKFLNIRDINSLEYKLKIFSPVCWFRLFS